MMSSIHNEMSSWRRHLRKCRIQEQLEQEDIENECKGD
jgi:hypothetical protein